MYLKKLFLFAIMTFFLVACSSDPKPTETAALSPTPQENQKTPEDKLAHLKANAFAEDDHFGRVNHSLGLVQKQFTISNQLDTPKGKQSIFVDERFTIIVRSEVEGKVYDAKVNLKNLDQRNGGMRLIPDVELDELPGFAISVLEGKPGVEIIENGKVVREERELQIFMADRSLIEQAIPAFLQALNVVHGRT